jgi:heme a synthase
MERTSHPFEMRAVRLWLYAVAALVFVMVLVGGATRLTESGLSITEWKPVTGAIPPLSEADWQAEFAKYRTIPQYAQMNAGMTLVAFKTIFWWEWTHRFLGRLVGIAYLLPFLIFLWRGWIAPEWRPRLWGIFGLGALQGAVGWWMVASGLVDRINVAPLRLAFHLTLAAVIYAALIFTADRMGQGAATSSASRASPASLRGGEADEAIQERHGKKSGLLRSARNDGTGRTFAVVLLVLVLAQIYLGALVAGLRAGYVYNTWPLIDGALVPAAGRLWFETPWWANLFDNALTVQFMHRLTAYGLVVAAAAHAYMARGRAGGRSAAMLFVAVLVQATLGILTLVHVVPIGLALAHQAMAMAVLALATLHMGQTKGMGRETQARKLSHATPIP